MVFTPRADEPGVDFVGRVRMGPLLVGAVLPLLGGVPDGIRRLVEASLSRTYQDRLTVSRPHATPVWPSARGTGRGGPKARRALARAGRMP